jgi:probable F420-dependent oxidoreductase
MVHTGGPYGVWRRGPDLDPELAATLERLGFGALWIGGSPAADLTQAEQLLDATSTLTVGTGIVNIWSSDAAEVAASFHRIEARHPGRFALGIGVGHPESAGARAAAPYTALVDYLDTLDAHDVPSDRVVLAALGPRVLRLARERTAGAHPYLVTPAHTVEARAVLGADRLLVPEQHVVLDADTDRAREVARAALANYLRLGNYRNSWLRQGFTEDDLGDGGGDAFVDDVVVHGGADVVAARLREHLDAGADQVAVQLLGTGTQPADDFARLADALGLAGR